MATERRIYRCADRNADDALPRLIRAGNPAQVRNHASRTQYDVEVADQEDLVELVSKGVKVEDAGEAPE